MSKNYSTLVSGALVASFSLAICAPFFVVAAEPAGAANRNAVYAGQGSAIAVESRELPKTTYRQPVEDNRLSGIEDQYQLQLLQQEVMELRGLIEESKYQLQQLKAVQDDRYLELDARLQSLLNTKGAGPIVHEAVSSDAIGQSDGAQLDEKTLYDTSLQLIRNRQFDLAITQLQSVIEQFPDGVFAPNAYYWLGEVYVAKPDPDLEKARQALAQVISYFPQHRKVPDAAFKLAKVYHLLGDCARATELLTEIVRQHNGKSVAKLADTYLRESVDCDS